MRKVTYELAAAGSEATDAAFAAAGPSDPLTEGAQFQLILNRITTDPPNGDADAGRSQNSATMHLEERAEGDYRIFTGAVEAPQGDGYTTAVVVARWLGPTGSTGEVFRDENIACGHRWATADGAIRFAMRQGLMLVSLHTGRPVQDLIDAGRAGADVRLPSYT